MERLLLDCSVRLALIVLGARLLSLAFRLAAPALVHRLWTAALAAMLVLPLWIEWGPSIATPILPAPAATETAIAHPPAAASIDAFGRGVAVGPNTPLDARDARGFARAVAQQAQTPGIRAVQTPRTQPIDWRPFLLALYLAGVAVMLIRLLRATLRVRALMRAARPMGGFAVSPHCSAPVAAGWLRPMLLLPESYGSWSAAKLDAVLAHERAHILRRDPLIQWLALFNRAIFWFHPLAWWIERQLAVLAEESCDAAVLERGIAPGDYAACLIDIARSVTVSGARLRSAGAVPFSNGNLSRRIRRIMDGADAPAAPLAKSIAAAVLCACLFTALLACRPTSQTREVRAQTAAGKIFADYQTMGAQERTSWRAEQRARHEEAITAAARSLTPAGAGALARALEANAQDHDKMVELRRYYEIHNDRKSVDAQTFWFIERHPEVRDGWGFPAEWNYLSVIEDRPRAIELWREQLKKSWDSPFVYMNAADFLTGLDNGLAEQALLDGRRIFPSPALHWEVFLGALYAKEVTGSGEPYASKARQTLLASNDFELLDRTIEKLQFYSYTDFSQTLVERVLTLKPDDMGAHRWRYHFQLAAARFTEQTAPASLTEPARMLLLADRLLPGERLRRNNVADPAAAAAQLLDMAARNPKDSNCGVAIFAANVTLGQSLLDRGDAPGAARHLLAALDAPPSDFLRYVPIDMTLARRLVDAGQRDAVAGFLERCAKITALHRPYKKWAAEIRERHNPMLSPYSNQVLIGG